MLEAKVVTQDVIDNIPKSWGSRELEAAKPFGLSHTQERDDMWSGKYVLETAIGLPTQTLTLGMNQRRALRVLAFRMHCVAGVGVPDALQVTIIRIDDYRKAQWTDLNYYQDQLSH